jgi:hypothetical protein
MMAAALGLQGAESKLAPDLQNLDPDKEVDVIIQYRESAGEGTGRQTMRFALPSGIAARRGTEGLSLISAVGARAHGPDWSGWRRIAKWRHHPGPGSTGYGGSDAIQASAGDG